MKLEQYQHNPDMWKKALRNGATADQKRGFISTEQIGRGASDQPKVISPVYQVLEQAKSRIKNEREGATPRGIKRKEMQSSAIPTKKPKGTHSSSSSQKKKAKRSLKSIFERRRN